MTATIKPIQTRYNGHHFRSRLEARWAVFFDELGLEWEYEPEGFDLGDLGLYLPDFRVWGFPRMPSDIWVEVKAESPSADEINKLRKLCCMSSIHGYFAIGTNVFREIATLAKTGLIDNPYEGYGKVFSHWQGPHYTFIPLGIGNVEKLVGQWNTPEGERFYDKLHDLILKGNYYEVDFRGLVDASRAALSARFEHGECGPT